MWQRPKVQEVLPNSMIAGGAKLHLGAGHPLEQACVVWHLTFQVFGDIEIGFVQGQRLDQWCVLGKDFPDLLRDLPIDLEARRYKDQLGGRTRLVRNRTLAEILHVFRILRPAPNVRLYGELPHKRRVLRISIERHFLI